jgi:hypothetical protein
VPGSRLDGVGHRSESWIPDVSFEPPVEHRGIAHDVAGAVIVYVVTKPLD